MRKWIAFLLVLSLAACSAEKQEHVIEKKPEAVMPTVQVESSKEEPPKVEPESEPKAELEPVRVLHLDKTTQSWFEWSDERVLTLAESTYSRVTLREDEREDYPDLSRTLAEAADMQSKVQEEEWELLLGMVDESLEPLPEDFEGYHSKLDTQVRRADSVAVSLVTDSYSDYGGIGGLCVLLGKNYDSQRGQQLLLSEVVTDMELLPSLVEEQLSKSLWTGELYNDHAIEDYFTQKLEEDISWTLDYHGVTFYFSYDIADGMQIVTLPFAEYPDLVQEYYTNVPDSYSVQLSNNAPYNIDLDQDGDCEELIVFPFYNEELSYYSSIDISTADCSYNENIFAQKVDAYYVKAPNGENYLHCYLYDNLQEPYIGSLQIYRLDAEKIDISGELAVLPHGTVEKDRGISVCELPLDPLELNLDLFDTKFNELLDTMVFTVDLDGMPALSVG